MHSPSMACEGPICHPLENDFKTFLMVVLCCWGLKNKNTEYLTFLVSDPDQDTAVLWEVQLQIYNFSLRAFHHFQVSKDFPDINLNNYKDIQVRQD